MANTVLGTAANILNAVKTWANGKFALSSKVGAANGIATLDADGKVPSSQLPSYVDDVLEYSAKTSFPSTGETGKIYVNTADNKTYRWSGSQYIEISASLALGETSSTAYAGDKGAANATAISTHTGNTGIHVTSTEKTTWNNKGTYSKPSGGIPKTDLAAAVQTSLGKADTALQSYTEKYTGTYSKPSGGIPKTDLASAVQTSLGKADTALQSHQDISGKADVSNTNQTLKHKNYNAVGGAMVVCPAGTSDSELSGIDTLSEGGFMAYGGNSANAWYGYDGISFSSGTQINPTTFGAKADKATTLSGYGITDAKISNGVITLGGNTITPLTSHQDISGKADKANITAGTAGESSATSGAKISVPYVTVNAQGIVTGYGTHEHTVNGFLTSHQSLAGYVPTSRTVAGHALTSDVTIAVADISDLEFMTAAEMTALLEA